MKAQFYCIKVLITSLFLSLGTRQAVNAQSLTLQIENFTAGNDGSTAWVNDVIECTLSISTNGNPVTNATLANIIPAGAVYKTGTTTFQGINIPDVNGNMPFANGGLLNGGTLPANSSFLLYYEIIVSANGGIIQNTPRLLGDNGVNVASNTTSTTIMRDGECSGLYTVTGNFASDNGGSNTSLPYFQIKLLNTTTGTAGSTLYNGSTGLCNEIVSGTTSPLTAGTLLTNVGAMAFDQSSIRLYFLNNSATTSQDLCFVDIDGVAGSVAAYRFTGYSIGTNITRMTMGISSIGYALTDDGSDLVSFTVNGNTPVINHLGPLINNAANAFDVLTERGGDIFSDGTGQLYLIVNSNRVYKIDPATRVTTYMGTLTFSPANTRGCNSVAVSNNGNIYLGGNYSRVYRVSLTNMTATGLNATQTNVWSSGDFASCGLPVQPLRVATGEKPAVNIAVEEVSVKVQPNPFNKELSMQVQLKTAEVVKVRLIDINGRTVYSTTEKLGAGANSLRLPVPRDLGSGLYIVEIYAGENRLLQKKLLKQ